MKPESWLKRLGMALAGLVLRLFGMRLIAGVDNPADEYQCGPFRTADPPPIETPPSKPKSSLKKRVFNWLRSVTPSFFKSREFPLTILAATAAAAVVASVWGIWYLFAQDVPSIISYQLTPDHTPQGVEQNSWIISLPFVVSRWWDVAFAALWAAALSLLISSFRNSDFNENETTASLFGALIPILIGGLAAACVGCKSPDMEFARTTWQGALAAAFIVPSVAALICSIIITSSEKKLGSGLRVVWCITLSWGFIAAVIFGSPGGLLFGFVVGAFCTLLSTLIWAFIRLSNQTDF
ncbi:hypothetical protein KKF05_02355 [Patescibacteria group bacterium]|nr:hypothetical protein [Patescibacteria group bacterium]MBU1916297.1 hypothetical protein [Patescibacteria group bacterium]